MSTGVVAAGAAAFALYVYLKQKGIQDGASMEPVLPLEVSRNAPDHAPATWSEALYHVKEVLKYMLNETLGRWHTIDLFVGLAYLSHREAQEYPAADIASIGFPVTRDIGAPDQIKLMLDLQEFRRYMLYCKGLKLRREEMQARFWKEHLGADTLTIVKQQPTAGVLRPAYVVVTDRALRTVVLCIRGTHSMKDLFTSLAGAAKPHHVVDPATGQLVLGYAHLGMLAAARWLLRQVTPVLQLALEAHPGYSLRVVGHSMGGGTAALLTMMFRDGAPPQPPTFAHQHSHLHPFPSPSAAAAAAGSGPSFAGAASPGGGGSGGSGYGPHPSAASTPNLAFLSDPPAAAAASFAAGAGDPDASPDNPFRSARCVAIACPSVMTLELAAACRDYVTSIVHGTDIVPTFCADSVDRLREDVTRSSWFSEFSRDMRSGVVRALQGGVRGMGTATQWTSRNILQPAVVPFKACYKSTTSLRRLKRRAASPPIGPSASSPGVGAGGLGGASLLSSPGLCPAFAAVEQEEQMLLAAGAGGGAAAAAAAAAAVAALDGSPGSLSGASGAGGSVFMPSPSSAALLAALTSSPSAAGLTHGSASLGPQAGGSPSHLPPRAQAMSPLAGLGTLGGLGTQQGARAAGPSGLDQRAMAEAVQSCMYAVESAVTARQHHQLPRGTGHTGPSDPAMAEALSLLESLPPGLGPSRPVGHPGANRHSRSRSREDAAAAAGVRRSDTGSIAGLSTGASAGAAGGDMEAEEHQTGSLLAGSNAAAVGGIGAVSTALGYGTSLRRRLWFWGPGQGPGHDGGVGGAGGPDGTAGAGSGSSGSGGGSPHAGASGAAFTGGDIGPSGSAASYGLLADDGAGGSAAGTACSAAAGGAAMMPPHVVAPDSPGKAKAAAAGASGGSVTSVGLVGSATLSSTRAFGDWLWRGGGMLFNTCTAPRRPISSGGVGFAGGGGPGLGRWGTGGGAGAGWSLMGARAAGGGGRGLAGSATASRGARSATPAGRGPLQMDVGEGYDDESDPEDEDEEEDDDEGSATEGDEDDDDEEEGMEEEGNAGGTAHRGGQGGSPGASGSASGSGAAAGEQQLQAGITAVVAAVTNQASREAAEEGLHDETTRAAEEVLREVRAADEAAAVAAASGGNARRGRRAGGRATGTAAGTSGAAAGMPRTASEAGGLRTLRGRRRRAGATEGGITEEGGAVEAPLSPTGGDADSAEAEAEAARTASSLAAEYEARMYKRKLYPAGRILHLFPNDAIAMEQRRPWPSPGSTAAAAAAADGAAASTTAADAVAARSSASKAPYYLYEIPDRQAYSRVRLCRTMVSDHLIPAYLIALDDVMLQLEEEQQRAARAAWEAEEERERVSAGGAEAAGPG